MLTCHLSLLQQAHYIFSSLSFLVQKCSFPLLPLLSPPLPLPTDLRENENRNSLWRKAVLSQRGTSNPSPFSLEPCLVHQEISLLQHGILAILTNIPLVFGSTATELLNKFVRKLL